MKTTVKAQEIKGSAVLLETIDNNELLAFGRVSPVVVMIPTIQGPKIFGVRENGINTPGSYDIENLPQKGLLVRLAKGDQASNIELPIRLSTSPIGTIDQDGIVALENALMYALNNAMIAEGAKKLNWTLAADENSQARLVALKRNGEGTYDRIELADYVGMIEVKGFKGAMKDGQTINVLFGTIASGPALIELNPLNGEFKTTLITIDGAETIELGSVDVSKQTFTSAFTLKVDGEWKTYLKLDDSNEIQLTTIEGNPIVRFNDNGSLHAIGENGTVVAYGVSEEGVLNLSQFATVIPASAYDHVGIPATMRFDVRGLIDNMLFVSNVKKPGNYALIGAETPTFAAAP